VKNFFASYYGKAHNMAEINERFVFSFFLYLKISIFACTMFKIWQLNKMLNKKTTNYFSEA